MLRRPDGSRDGRRARLPLVRALLEADAVAFFVPALAIEAAGRTRPRAQALDRDVAAAVRADAVAAVGQAPGCSIELLQLAEVARDLRQVQVGDHVGERLFGPVVRVPRQRFIAVGARAGHAARDLVEQRTAPLADRVAELYEVSAGQGHGPA